MLERVWRKGDPSTLLAECKLMGPLWMKESPFGHILDKWAK